MQGRNVCNAGDIKKRRITSNKKGGFGGLGVSMLANGTLVRGFEPGQSRRIFQGEKNPQHTVGPMSQICGM
jgi:hypothetical protein